MSYRDLMNVGSLILKNAVIQGGKNGALNISTIKLADDCGISEYTVFRNFPTKAILLKKTYIYCYKKLINGFENVIGYNSKDPDALFSQTLDIFMNNVNETDYLWSYCNTVEFVTFEKTEMAPYYIDFARLHFPKQKDYSDHEVFFNWEMFVDTLILYSKMVHAKQIEDSPENRELLKKYLSHFLSTLV